MFVLNHWLREFPLSAVAANRLELRCQLKQLLLFYHKICRCYVISKEQMSLYAVKILFFPVTEHLKADSIYIFRGHWKSFVYVGKCGFESE